MKKGILIVSFGTSYAKTRAVTIEAIEETIRQAYPDVPVYSAWTSGIIREKILEATGEHIADVSQAMEEMKENQITDIYIQPTHVINGTENEQMREDALKFRGDFHSISFGAPLISSTEDMREMIHVLTREFSSLHEDEALILMGHGSEHYSNTVYPALDYMFQEMGHGNIHIGTVEGYPELEHVLSLLKKQKTRKIHLAPLMIVAGDHAVNDMAGNEPDSWKSVFESHGYEVTCHLKGLGEYPEVQQMFLKHLGRIIN